MKELLVILSKTLSFEKMLELVEDQINEYKKDPSEKNKKNLSPLLTIVLLHIKSEGEDAFKVIQRLRREEDLLKHFDNLQ